jgi:F-type H+-transporting ATPase subunit delta
LGFSLRFAPPQVVNGRAQGDSNSEHGHVAAENANSATSEAADRYASAAFDLAKEQNQIDALDKDFATFGEALAASSDLRAAIASPLISAEEKSRALVAVAGELGLSTLGRNLLGVAARNGRANELPGIVRAFRRLVAAHRGLRRVEIVSAAPLAQPQLDSLVAALSSALGAKVDPTVTVDESLIGGFIVRAGSRQYDSSIKTKLDSFKLALKGA